MIHEFVQTIKLNLFNNRPITANVDGAFTDALRLIIPTAILSFTPLIFATDLFAGFIGGPSFSVGFFGGGTGASGWFGGSSIDGFEGVFLLEGVLVIEGEGGSGAESVWTTTGSLNLVFLVVFLLEISDFAQTIGFGEGGIGDFREGVGQGCRA